MSSVGVVFRYYLVVVAVVPVDVGGGDVTHTVSIEIYGRR